MKIAVTGATGFIGQYVVAQLLRSGYEVNAMVRHDPDHATHGVRQDPSLTWFAGELGNATAIRSLVEGCDGVVHAAFDHVAGRYRGGEGADPERFMEVNVNQSKHLLETLARCDVSRTVFLSSRAVYDGLQYGDSLIPDGTETAPAQLYGEAKTQVERAGVAMSEIGFCYIRATGVYGVTTPVIQSKWYDLVGHVVRRTPPIDVEKSDQSRTEVHAEDLAAAIELLLRADQTQVAGRSFNCSDIAVSNAQLIELVTRIRKDEDPLADPLPQAIPPSNRMSCERLLQLGWQPSGWTKLVATLRQLIAAHDATP